MSLALYFHTIRHLRPVQIYGRIFHWLKRPFLRPSLKEQVISYEALGSLSFPMGPVRMTGKMEFIFLNLKQKIESPQDWALPGRPQLWNYHLHYFDDLLASGQAQRLAWHLEYIERWIGENPVGQGDGWRPYPLSLRIVNWIKWHCIGQALTKEALKSLYQQVSYLRSSIEYHLQGNHLFVNGKALLFAGLFFGEKEWEQCGQDIVFSQFSEQVLADGAHFELTPMYHALFLEDVLDVWQILRAYGRPTPKAWESIIPQMLKFLLAMTYPNGELAHFNDSTQGIAKSTEALLQYSEILGLAPARSSAVSGFANAGLVRVDEGQHVLIFDNGPLGPDFLLSHAHADTLSFELFAFGKKLFCNLGISQYGHSRQRLSERSTASHNTVEIDGENSSQVWQGFRVAKRARSTKWLVQGESVAQGVQIVGAHNGYERLSPPLAHERRLHWHHNVLTITDELRGRGAHRFRCFFHLHPSWRCQLEEGGKKAMITDQHGHQVLAHFSVGAKLSENFYHPEFGASVPCSTLELIGDFVDGQTLTARIELCASIS